MRAILATALPFALSSVVVGCVGAAPTLVPTDSGTGTGSDSTTHDGSHPTSDSGNDVTTKTDAGKDAGGGADTASPPIDAGHDVGVDALCGSIVANDGAAPGSLDPSFNNVVEPTTLGGPNQLLRDGAGRFYLVGSKMNCVSATSNADFAITRLTSEGAVDTTFGVADAGQANLSASGGTVCIDFIGGADLAGAAAFDPSGNIVLGGLATEPGTGTVQSYYYTSRIALARLKPNGTLDTSFNGTGELRVAAADGPPEAQEATSLAIDALGDIFAVGSTQALPVPASGSATADYNQLAGFIVKVTGTTGNVATLWGSQGFVTDDSLSELKAAAVTGTSLFVVGSYRGAADAGTPHRRFVTRKYTTTGQGGLDTTWNASDSDAGTPGEVLTAPSESSPVDSGVNDYPQSVLIDPQGNIVVAGFASVYTPTLGGNGGNSDVYGPGYAAIVRYLPNGKLDPSFGTNGVYVSPDLKGFPGEDISMLGAQCDGKLLLGALVDPNASITVSGQSIAVLRLTPDGKPDPAYGTSKDAGVGITELELAGTNSLVISLLVDPQQRALVLSGNGTAPVLTRFLP